MHTSALSASHPCAHVPLQAQSQQTGDAEGAQARPVVQAINRERSQQGRSPVERLTVPLLKEHLRGKTCGGNPWKPGAKKRSELISDYR